MAYDPADGYVVLFGGEALSPGSSLATPLADTWTYKGGVWTEIYPSPSPPARAAATFVYDTYDSKLLLFGGENLGGSLQSPGPSAVLDDTWTFSGGKWTELTPSTSPPARFGAVADYDVMDGYVLVFGGYTWSSSGSLVLQDDLWSFKGGAWTSLPMQAGSSSVGVPAGYRTEAMAYDPYDGYSLLYDGGTTWYYEGGYWYELSASSPADPDFECTGTVPTCIEGMAYDPSEKYVVYQTLTSTSSGVGEQTWEFRAGSWQEVTASTAPSQRVNAAMTYDMADGYVLLFGGYVPDDINDTWIYPPPLSVTVASNRSSLDANQLVTFTANPSGGYPGYSYTWTAPANLTCPASTAISISCTASSASKTPLTMSVTATDSTGATSGPSTATFRIDTDPDVPEPSASIPTADVGTAVTFSDHPSGGSGVFTYAWSGLPTGTGCTSANSSSIACTPTQQSTSYVSVSVKDTYGYSTTSSPTLFVVHSSPFVSLALNRTNLDANEPLLFYANASGGTGVYSYSYNGLPAGCSTLNTSRLQCTPTSTGTFTVNVTVTDTGGGKYTSNNASFSVYPDPRVTSYWFPVGGQVAYANESLSLEINFTGGIGPYSSCISGPPAWPTGCVSGLGGSNLTIPDYQPFTSAGTYPVKVNITDSTGWVSSVTFDVHVYYPILVTPPSIGAVHEGVPTNASFSINSLHGALPMTWWLNDTTLGTGLCGPAAASSYGAQQCTFTPAWNGTDQLNLTLKDALHTRLFVTFTYSVPAPLGSLTLKATAGSKSATQGGTLQNEVGWATSFTANWKGGDGSYTCVLAENTTGYIVTQGVSTHSCTLTFTWSHPATYTVALLVNDSIGATGGSVSQVIFVDVVSKLSAGSVTPSSSTVDVGVADNLSESYSGGWPNFTFSWNLDDGVVLNTTVPWLVYAWPKAGSYWPWVTITDGLGQSSTSVTFSVTVVNSPAVTGMDVTDGPISVTNIGSGGSVSLPVGTNVTLNLTLHGGQGPYHYTWIVNGQAVSSVHTSDLWTSYSTSWAVIGNETVNVTVVDDESEVVNFTLTAEVITDTIGPISLMVTHVALDLGMWDNTSLTWTGGWGPFSFHYLIVTPGARTWLNTTSTSLHMMWNETGTVSISVAIIDGFGHKGEQNISFTVNPALVAACAPSYSGTPAPGANLTFTLGCLSGGTSPYAYRWTAGSVVTTSATPSILLAFTEVGIYNVSVQITDAVGASVESKVVSVAVDQLGPLSLQLERGTTDVDVKDDLSLTFAGGIGPFVYDYYFSTATRGWWQNSTSEIPALDFTSPGNVTVEVMVTDRTGISTTGNVTVLVNPDPTVDCAPAYTGSPEPGKSLTFTVGCLAGGTGPFSYVWTLGGVTKVTTIDTVTFTFTEPGTYGVSVNVTDSLGMGAGSKILQLSVQTPSGGGNTTGGLSSSTIYALVGLLAVIIVVVALALFLLARRRKPASTTGGGQRPDQDAISREVRSRTEGKWVEENALVQETSTATGKDHSIVRGRIQMLCENHWMEKQSTGKGTEYRWVGSKAFQDERETARVATINQLVDEALMDPENAGGVTGAELKARGGRSGLDPSPDELEWRAYMGDRVQAGKVVMDDGPDFETTMWRLKIAEENGPEPSADRVHVDEGSLQDLLQRQEQEREEKHGASFGGSEAAGHSNGNGALPEWSEDHEGGESV